MSKEFPSDQTMNTLIDMPNIVKKGYEGIPKKHDKDNSIKRYKKN